MLNPVEVATTDRIEIDLHAGATQIGEEGVDWGQAEVDAYMANGTMGSKPIDNVWPNRVITIPLLLGVTGDFDAARIAIQAEVSRINEEGGTIKREIIGGSYGEAGKHVFADVVKANLKLNGGTEQATLGLDSDAEVILEVLPDFYGDPVALPAFEGTGDASSSFQIIGNLPARADLTVVNKSGNDQLGLGWCFRCRNYSAEESAGFAYEAEDLTPLDLAEITTLSGASGGSAVQHGNLGTGWTPVLGTNIPPRVRSVAAAAASTGAIKPPLPANVKEDDILVMFIETANQPVAVPSGWAHVAGSPVEVASGNTTCLTVLWKRAGASETAPDIADPGDHIIARVMAVSGCIKIGNPWDVAKAETELVSDTSASAPTATTTVDSCLVLTAIATGSDVSSSANVSAWTNPNLQALTERMDSWTAESGGGGFGVASGIKLKAGAIGATTATIAAPNFKALMTIALKPETGGNFLSHIGTYDVWCRAYTTSAIPPWLRILSDVGDLVAPAEGVAVQVPGPNNYYLVPLGQINLGRFPVGEHRWQGSIQARGAEGGENLCIDRLWFFCADESSGIPRGVSPSPISLSPSQASIQVRDEFNQPPGSATGKVAAVGGPYEALPNSDTTDFEVDSTTHRLKRNAVSDTGTNGAASLLKGRGIAPPVEFTNLAMRSDFTIETANAESSLTRCGHVLGYTGKEQAVFVQIYMSNGVWWVRAMHASAVLLAASEVPRIGSKELASGTLASVVTGNRLTVYCGGAGQPLDLVFVVEHAAIGIKSKAYIFDESQGAAAATRWYDNLSIWAPGENAAIFANRNARLGTQGLFRQSRDGIGYGPIAYPGSDLPRIPVSGPEKRPVEIALKPSRGDFGSFPDFGLDGVQGGGSYRPCWSGVPES